MPSTSERSGDKPSRGRHAPRKHRRLRQYAPVSRVSRSVPPWRRCGGFLTVPTLGNVSEQTLTSLAVLTVNWNHGQDVIDSFVPLVAECIRKGADDPVSAVELQK